MQLYCMIYLLVGWLVSWGGYGSGGRAGRPVIGRWSLVQISAPTCMSKQDTESKLAHDEQLAPCMAASAISV